MRHPKPLPIQPLFTIAIIATFIFIPLCPTTTAADEINVYNPSGGTWHTQDTINITWTPHNFPATIQLYHNNDLVTTIAISTSAPGYYHWTIPATIQSGTNYKIHISDSTNQTYDGYSATFTIERRTITITSPTPNTSFYTGDTMTITWTSENVYDTITINAYDSNAATWHINTLPIETQTTTWKIPEQTPAGTCRIQIRSNPYSLSTNTTITIKPRRLTINTPTTTLYIGETYTITWTSENAGPTVTLLLQQKQQYRTLFTITPETQNDGNYNWLIPTLDPNATYTIIIQSLTYTQITNTTNPFTLQERYLTITTPTANTTWYLGNTYTITWTSKNAGPHVTLTLYQQGTPQATIATNTTNNGTYTWTIPTTLTPDQTSTIQIKSTTIDTLRDQSNAFPLLKKTIHITSPAPETHWQQGDRQTITWNTQGFSSNVRIELCQALTAAYTLTANTSNTGSFTWTIPTDLIPNIPYQIKITSLIDDTLYSYSPEIFIQQTFLQQWWMLITMLAIVCAIFLVLFVYLIRRWKTQSSATQQPEIITDIVVPKIDPDEYDNIWEPQRPK